MEPMVQIWDLKRCIYKHRSPLQTIIKVPSFALKKDAQYYWQQVKNKVNDTIKTSQVDWITVKW